MSSTSRRYSCLFLLRAFVKTNVAARYEFQAQNTPRCICGWGFAPDPMLGQPTQHSPDALAGFQGPLRGRVGERKRRGRGRKGKEGGAFPHFFFTISPPLPISS